MSFTKYWKRHHDDRCPEYVAQRIYEAGMKEGREVMAEELENMMAPWKKPELVHAAEGALQYLRHLEECPINTTLAEKCTCEAMDADARLMRALRTTG